MPQIPGQSCGSAFVVAAMKKKSKEATKAMSRHKSVINRILLFRVRGSQNSWAMSRYSFHKLKSSLETPERSPGVIDLSCF